MGGTGGKYGKQEKFTEDFGGETGGKGTTWNTWAYVGP